MCLFGTAPAAGRRCWVIVVVVWTLPATVCSVRLSAETVNSDSMGMRDSLGISDKVRGWIGSNPADRCECQRSALNSDHRLQPGDEIATPAFPTYLPQAGAANMQSVCPSAEVERGLPMSLMINVRAPVREA